MLGLPNAGKSTLINRLVGANISIVTHKAQTTRSRMRGIALLDSTQAVFVDTPGIFASGGKPNRMMLAAAWGSLAGAEIALVVVDAARAPAPEFDAFLSTYARRLPAEMHSVLALNKIDRIPRDTLLARTEAVNRQARFDATFMISARTGSGVDDLAGWIAGTLPERPWMYPEGQTATAPLRHLASEITRGELMLRMHDEIPYAIAVRTHSWETLPDGAARVEQDIYVTRESHRRMVIGRGGHTLGEIGRAARLKIAELADMPVHLHLRVRLRPAEVAAEQAGTATENGP